MAAVRGRRLQSEENGALADAVDRLREIGVAAQSFMFGRAFDEVLTGVLVEEAGRLRDQLPRRDTPSAATLTSAKSTKRRPGDTSGDSGG